MSKKSLFQVATFLMVVFQCAYFTSCSKDDDKDGLPY